MQEQIPTAHLLLSHVVIKHYGTLFLIMLTMVVFTCVEAWNLRRLYLKYQLLPIFVGPVRNSMLKPLMFSEYIFLKE